MVGAEHSVRCEDGLLVPRGSAAPSPPAVAAEIQGTRGLSRGQVLLWWWPAVVPETAWHQTKNIQNIVAEAQGAAGRKTGDRIRAG